MEAIDAERFARIIGGLCEVYGKESTKNLNRLYFEALKAYNIEELSWAAMEAIKTLKWFPKPVELGEIALGAPRHVKIRAGIVNEERLQIPDLTPPAEARKKLEEISQILNEKFGTSFSVENDDRPMMKPNPSKTDDNRRRDIASEYPES